MTRFLGEFECNLDGKGRIMIPKALKNQLLPEAKKRFVVNRGFEKCLVLYPFNEWEQAISEISTLNLYVKKNREFIRYFYRGATELKLDSNNRLLIPGRLLKYTGAKKTLTLFAYSNRIEIWAKDIYDKLLGSEPEDFSDLAEEVMGKPDDTK